MIMNTLFNDVEKLLPQKNKMVLLSRILACHKNEKELISEVLISRDSMFFDEKKQYVPVWVGIEYMAQSIAAFSYLVNCGTEAETEPKIGFLLGTRKYDCSVFGFKLNQVLQINVKQLYYDNNLAAFECSIKDKEQLLAKAQVNAFSPDSVTEFLKKYQ